MEKFEEREVGQDRNVRVYLNKLYNMGIQVLRVIDAVVDIPTRREGRGTNGDDELDWQCPNESYFYPPIDVEVKPMKKKHSHGFLEVPKTDITAWPSHTIVDTALSEIGVGIFNLASNVSELVASKREVFSICLIYMEAS
jgi:hypothetical protein